MSALVYELSKVLQICENAYEAAKYRVRKHMKRTDTDRQEGDRGQASAT